MLGVNIGVAAPVAWFPFARLEGLDRGRPARERARRGRVLHAAEGRHEPLVSGQRQRPMCMPMRRGTPATARGDRVGAAAGPPRRAPCARSPARMTAPPTQRKGSGGTRSAGGSTIASRGQLVALVEARRARTRPHRCDGPTPLPVKPNTAHTRSPSGGERRQVGGRGVDRAAPGVLDAPAGHAGEEAHEVAGDLAGDHRVDLGGARRSAPPGTIRPPPQPKAMRPSGVGAEVVDERAAVGDRLAAGAAERLEHVRHRLGDDHVARGAREPQPQRADAPPRPTRWRARPRRPARGRRRSRPSCRAAPGPGSARRPAPRGSMSAGARPSASRAGWTVAAVGMNVPPRKRGESQRARAAAPATNATASLRRADRRAGLGHGRARAVLRRGGGEDELAGAAVPGVDARCPRTTPRCPRTDVCGGPAERQRGRVAEALAHARRRVPEVVDEAAVPPARAVAAARPPRGSPPWPRARSAARPSTSPRSRRRRRRRRPDTSPASGGRGARRGPGLLEPVAVRGVPHAIASRPPAPRRRRTAERGALAPGPAALPDEVQAHEDEHDEQQPRGQHVDLGRHALARGAEDEQRERLGLAVDERRDDVVVDGQRGARAAPPRRSRARSAGA